MISMKKYFKPLIICFFVIVVILLTFLLDNKKSDVLPKEDETIAAEQLMPLQSIEYKGESDFEVLPEPVTQSEMHQAVSEEDNRQANLETVEKSEEVNEDKSCTFSIVCNTILANKDKIKPEKLAVVPVDGVVYQSEKVSFSEGASVFDVLQDVTKKAKIHMEFVETPGLNSVYIEGINGIYEFDCGDFSGWVYRVNGKIPGIGCSEYILKNGDAVEWIYTCDMSRDIS